MQNLKSLLLNSRILLVLILLALFAGCSDDDDKGSTAQPGSLGKPGTLERLFSYPTITSCGTCHYGGGTGPDLSKANFTSSLVNRKSNDYQWTDFTNKSSDCAGVYVSPYAIKDSSILKIISTQNGTCGAYNYHTTHGGAISGAILEDFVLWIENGTPAN